MDGQQRSMGNNKSNKNSSITSFFPSLTNSNKSNNKLDSIQTHNNKQQQQIHCYSQLQPVNGILLKSNTNENTPTPIIITDLTLDSPVKPIPVPISSSNQSSQAGQLTTPLTTSDLSLQAPNKPVTLKTFSEFERARQKKAKNNSRPLVSPAWPSGDSIHQRFLENVHHHDRAERTTTHQLPRNKGKRPIRNSYLSDLDHDQGWYKHLVNISNQVDHTKALTPCPTLNRLDLQPPINLIPQSIDDPLYQHPLLQRLIKLLSYPDDSPITFDHPTLRRQHHRSSDSLVHLWTTRYAPKKAFEMLGDQNIQSALTLKSWLLEIALKEAHYSIHDEDQVENPEQGKKSAKQKKRKKPSTKQNAKRVIVRSVEPRKHKSQRLLGSDSDSDGLRDFIVSDDEDEDTIYAKDIIFSEPESCSPQRSLQSKTILSPQLAPVPETSSSKCHQGREQDQDLKIEFQNLTNLILLRGPNGSGKSCAVQAVAEELGWEVFEVNPGVVRNRKELDRLIGDVSRNHVLSCPSSMKFPAQSNTNRTQLSTNLSTVLCDSKVNPKLSSQPESNKPINPFARMMNKSTRDQAHESRPKRKIEDLETEENEIISNKSRSEKYHIKHESHMPPPGPIMVTSRSNQQQQRVQNPTKQSLIVLEEVDVIYAQDKDFWAGVIELVSKSMRPIVMTCNDLSALPMESLPIQMILEFQPPSVELASRFLQLICLIEGHLIDLKQLDELYRSNEHVYRLPAEFKLMGNKRTDFNLFETFQLPSDEKLLLNPEDGESDLRRTMNHLQFFCQWAIGSHYLGVDWLDLEHDKACKMLFCSNSLPSVTTCHYSPQLTKSHQPDHQNAFDSFADNCFELDWFNKGFLQLDEKKLLTQQTGLKSQLQPHPIPLNLTKFSHHSQELLLLAKAHDDLSFADAFVDKDFEIEVDQFESEIAYSATDNVILDTSRLGAASIEIKKTKASLNVNNKDKIPPDEEYDYDLQYQYLNPKRPFSSSNYSVEKKIFNWIFLMTLDSISSIPHHLALGQERVDGEKIKHSLLEKLSDHYQPKEYLFKYFRIFDHCQLVKIRTRNLKEMKEYMDFEGSRSYLLSKSIRDDILDYNSFVRIIFEFDQSKRSAYFQQQEEDVKQAGKNSVRFLRKSVRLNPTSSSLPLPSFILQLSPFEIRQFLKFIKKLE